MIERIHRRVQGQHTLAEICALFGVSRQAHYQAMHRDVQRQAREALVLAEVREIRYHHPRMGGRKIWHLLRQRGTMAAAAMGRDHLFALLRAHGLLVSPKQKRVRTTVPGRWRQPNLLVGMRIERPWQALVGDISYWRLQDGSFVYLYILMDLFSRALVGWHVGATLEAEEALQALKSAWHTWGLSRPLGFTTVTMVGNTAAPCTASLSPLMEGV